ncbi:purine-cytosine permease family protein [Rathayibacter soli]|uniref:purine-cytosine permease family protein n=1 Tax=Rathayibacter soli TaxID=3144168 RepID=UPI0027E3E24A|nr:cytosine permease [Glaciibacter superstes]
MMPHQTLPASSSGPTESDALLGTPDYEAQLQYIPESARTRKVNGQFWIWAGANIAPINWVLGALGIQLGLGFADTVTVLVIGNIIGMGVFGFFVLLGQRTGATAMVLGRAPFGRRGNYLPSTIQALLVIGWCAINTWVVLDLVMALIAQLGWVNPHADNYGWKIGVATFIMVVQVFIAWLGYKAIAAFERWSVPFTLAILAVMSFVAWFGMNINWGYAGQSGHILEGGPRIAAMTAVMTVIGIGWGITWFTYAADYSRFVSKSVPKSKLYWYSVFGQLIPTVWLGILGATLATKSATADPGQLIVENYGALAIPVLLLVLHGPIATNILNVYTFSMATQALDIKVSRKNLNLFVGVFSLILLIVLIFQAGFASTVDTWLGAIVAWVAAWAGVMLVHYYWLDKKYPINVDRLFDPIGTRRVIEINWAGMIAFLVGIFATWLFMYGSFPVMQGWVATALGGWDFSWLAGGLASAIIYAFLGPLVHRKCYLATLSERGSSKTESAAGPVAEHEVM